MLQWWNRILLESSHEIFQKFTFRITGKLLTEIPYPGRLLGRLMSLAAPGTMRYRRRPVETHAVGPAQWTPEEGKRMFLLSLPSTDKTSESAVAGKIFLKGLYPLFNEQFKGVNVRPQNKITSSQVTRNFVCVWKAEKWHFIKRHIPMESIGYVLLLHDGIFTCLFWCYYDQSRGHTHAG